MKLERIIPPVLLVVVVCDGLNGEFSSPTIYDLVKWFACAMLAVCWFVSWRCHHES